MHASYSTTKAMKQRATVCAKILTYGGTIPLIACGVFIAVPLSGIDSTLLAKTYSAVIISFLSGIHWACYLFFAERCPRNLLLTSNAVALLAWQSLLVHHHPWEFLQQILCFVYLLMLDYRLREAGILPPWFYTLRRNATVIVVVSLSILMVQG